MRFRLGVLILVVCFSVLAAPAASGWAQEASPVANDATQEPSPDAIETVRAAEEPSSTPTTEPTPSITINGSTEAVVYLDSDVDVIIVRSNIDYVLFFTNGDCSGERGGLWYDPSTTRALPASFYLDWAGGNTFSLQGYNVVGETGVSVTDCRRVIFDAAPTPTVVATPILTVNGSADPIVYVDPSGGVTFARENILLVKFYKNGDCSGNSGGRWYGAPLTLTNSAESWREWAGGTIFSLQGFNEDGDSPVTTCRTVMIGTAPTPTVDATPTVTETPTATTEPTTTQIPVGTLHVNVVTSDGADIPAGTTWLLSRTGPVGSRTGTTAFFAAQRTDSQGGTLGATLPSGSSLPIENPVTLGSWTLTINASGYQPLVETIGHDTDGTSVTVRLIGIPAPTSTVTTAPTEIITATAPSSATSPATELPNTGAGATPDRSGLLLAVAMTTAIILSGLGLRLRRR